MQKSMLLMVALLLSLFISGCGGGTTTSTIASTNDKLTASDIYKHTLNVTASRGTSSATFHTYSGTTRNDWNSNPLDTSVRQGTWSVVNGTVIFFDTNNNPVKTITGIQKVYKDQTNTNPPLYWLVTAFDGPPTPATPKPTFNCRMYVDTTAAFSDYTTSVAVRIGLIGGAIQSSPLPNLTTVSTVVGVTGQIATPFADYTAAAGRTPPVLLGTPIGITTIDGKTFFVLDNTSNRIHMVTLDSNAAATNVKTLRSTAIPSADILFNNPMSITTDGKNLYVTDTSNFTIDKIALVFDANGVATGTGTLSIVAGSTGASGAIDGTGNIITTTPPTTTGITTSAAIGTARFGGPVGITTDGTNLYVTDSEAIRKITLVPDGATPQVTTLAGALGAAGFSDSASTDTTGTNARFNLPLRLTTDGTNLYVTDFNNYTIRKVSIATGKVTTIAGSAGNFGTNNPTNLSNPTVPTGDQARFNGPNGITTDGTNLYVTDWWTVIYGNPPRGQVVFSIALANLTNPTSQYSGPVTRIAGTQNTIGSDSDAVPTAANASHFFCPIGITTDGTSLFVADSQNYTIRRIYKQAN